MILVRYGESEADADLLCEITNSHQKGVSDFIEWYKPYAFVERVDYSLDLGSLQDVLESHGITVWLITEPHGEGHHEVIFNRKATKKHGFDGIALMQRLSEQSADGTTK